MKPHEEPIITAGDRIRLQQLQAAIDNALADPTDHEATRTAGRLAGIVCLLALPDGDDRRALLLDVLSDGKTATSKPLGSG